MKKRIYGYWKFLKCNYDHWKGDGIRKRNLMAFSAWKQRFQNSNAQVLLGAHYHKQGGVRNHLLSIKKYSKLNILLVPEENDLQVHGVTPFNENIEDFHKTPPPKHAFAVHTHVLPWLIEWAMINAPKNLRWIHTHHLLYYPEAGKNGIEPWQQLLNESMIKGAKSCDVCICVSKWEQDTLKRTFNVDSVYLPNGVDTRLCDSANASRFLRKFGIQKDFVLWVGRNDVVKNPSDFIRTAQQNPSLDFVMIGGLTSELIRKEYHLNTPKNLRLLPMLHREDVLDAINACQVLLVTSLREGLPTLVLEAMTLQKQIVVPDEAGCLDATDGDLHARVYKLGDIEQLSRLTRDAFLDKKPRTRARTRVFKEFDWQVITNKLDLIYQGKQP